MVSLFLASCGGGSSGSGTTPDAGQNENGSSGENEPLDMVVLETGENNCLVASNADADFEVADVGYSFRHLIWNCSALEGMTKPKRIEFIAYNWEDGGCYPIVTDEPLVSEANCDELASAPVTPTRIGSITSFKNVTLHKVLESNPYDSYQITFSAEITNTGNTTTQWSVGIGVPGYTHPLPHATGWILPGETKVLNPGDYGTITIPISDLDHQNYSVHLTSYYVVDSSVPEGRYREIFSTIPMPPFQVVDETQ